VAGCRYSTSDNTPHSNDRYPTSTMVKEEEKREKLSKLQREADDMIAQLSLNREKRAEQQSCNDFDEFQNIEAAHPPPVDYPQRNLYGRWQVGEIELDSEADKDYINNMLEFKEMVTNLSNLDNHNAAHSSKVGRSIEGERCAAKKVSDGGSVFTIQFGDNFAEELMAAHDQVRN